MGHAVHYLDAAGEPRFELQPSLEAALEQVEHLRNDDDVTDVRVFREVPIEVKTYYKVVVAEDAAPAEAPQVPAVPAPVEAEAPEAEIVAAPDDSEVASLPPVAAVEELEAAPSEPAAAPLSGAVVMSPPPVTLHPEAAELDEVEHTEPRRALFSRG
jgi:hypothetical protein